MKNGDKTATVNCPIKASFIEQPESTIAFFGKARSHYRSGMRVNYNLENASEITETFAAALMSYIKDRNVNLGMISDIKFPQDEKLERKLKRFGIFKTVSNDTSDIKIGTRPTIRVANQLVATEIAKALVDETSQFVFGKKYRIKELYTTLIEMMANTNNHAIENSDNDQPYSWWLYAFPDQEHKCVKFVFLDLGVGIFESLPVKQYIRKISAPFGDLFVEKQMFERGNRIAEIFLKLISGEIKSRTGDPLRGKGIPLIFSNSKFNSFKDFYLISNDAFINFKTEKSSPMNENFMGTMFYFNYAGNRDD